MDNDLASAIRVGAEKIAQALFILAAAIRDQTEEFEPEPTEDPCDPPNYTSPVNPFTPRSEESSD